jgi:glyoxylate reductase
MPGRKRPLVVITRKLPDPVETRMRELFDARLNIEDVPLTQPQLVAAVREAEVLVPTVTDKIDEALIKQAGDQLKLIANYGNGVDNIDVQAAAAKGITVTNTPNVLTEDTADMTMALMMAVPRRLVEGANLLMSEEPWAGWSPTWMLGRRLWGKRLGIVGMGASALPWRGAPRLSACLSTITTAIASHRRSRRSWKRPTGTAWTRCWHAWTSSPSTAHRRRPHSISCRRAGSPCFSRARYIVNTARGDIIDEDALIKMLQEDKLGGAGSRRLRARAEGQSEAGQAGARRQGRHPAPYGLGHHGRPDRHGREGDHQHPHLL